MKSLPDCNIVDFFECFRLATHSDLSPLLSSAFSFVRPINFFHPNCLFWHDVLGNLASIYTKYIENEHRDKLSGFFRQHLSQPSARGFLKVGPGGGPSDPLPLGGTPKDLLGPPPGAGF